MKFYKSLDRDKPFGILDRLSRLLTFDFRVQFAVESGADFFVSLVVFGQGVGIGFTRGMPHIVAGAYIEVNILTERFNATAGFQSDWYATYVEGLPRAGIAGPVDISDHGIRNANDGSPIITFGEPEGGHGCGDSDGCCSHDDDEAISRLEGDGAPPHVPAHVTLGDLSVDRFDYERSILRLGICPQHGALENCQGAHDEAAGIAVEPTSAGEVQIVTTPPQPCGIARHREMGCDADCKGRPI